MPENERVLTYGEKAVGLSFNPSGDAKVNKLKELFAEIIDICLNSGEAAGRGEAARLYSVAITQAQAARMWAVKAATWRD
jgi:hypothetical protein